MTNIAASASDEILLHTFSQYGTLISITVIGGEPSSTTEETVRSCIVGYQTKEQADHEMAMLNGVVLVDKRMATSAWNQTAMSDDSSILAATAAAMGGQTQASPPMYAPPQAPYPPPPPSVRDASGEGRMTGAGGSVMGAGGEGAGGSLGGGGVAGGGWGARSQEPSYYGREMGRGGGGGGGGVSHAHG